MWGEAVIGKGKRAGTVGLMLGNAGRSEMGWGLPREKSGPGLCLSFSLIFLKKY